MIAAASASITGDGKPGDIIVNIVERALASSAEPLDAALEQLDGQLSLRNATVLVEY